MRPSLRWSTLPAGLAAGLVLILAFALVLVPQLTAVAITNLARFNELPRLTIFDAFRLWVTNDPTTVTCGNIWRITSRHCLGCSSRGGSNCYFDRVHSVTARERSSTKTWACDVV